MSSGVEKPINKKVQRSNSVIIRGIFFILGCIALTCGTIGIIMPVLPTVPFYLFTAYCFAKASKRFHDWFLNTTVYRKYMSGFAEHKSMTLRGELTLLILVSIMLTCAVYFVNIRAMAIVIPILILCKYSYFIFFVKTVSKQELLELQQSKEKSEIL